MRLRILHVIPDLGVGGAERVTVTLASAQARVHECSVLSLYDRRGSHLEDDLAQAGVELCTAGKHRGPDVRMPLAVARLIRRLEPDIVHTHRYALRYVAPALVPRPDLAVVHTVHNLVDREVPELDHTWRRPLFRSGRVVPVGVSRAVSGSVATRYGLAQCATVLNGVEPPSTATVPTPLPGRTRLLCVARLARAKGHDLLLEALARTADGCTLTCAGDGPLRQELESLSVRLGVRTRVRFLGAVRAVADLYREADVLVLPSRYEGSPLVVAEAMAAGLPVIATAVGGVPEMVLPGRTGLLVPPERPDALAAAISAVHVDAEQRRAWGTAARRHAVEALSATSMVSAYGLLYEDSLRIRRGRSSRP